MSWDWGQAGRLDNFILVGEDNVLNTDLRFPDEFARHKILDIIGDMYLLGYPAQGQDNGSIDRSPGQRCSGNGRLPPRIRLDLVRCFANQPSSMNAPSPTE